MSKYLYPLDFSNPVNRAQSLKYAGPQILTILQVDKSTKQSSRSPSNLISTSGAPPPPHLANPPAIRSYHTIFQFHDEIPDSRQNGETIM